MTLFEPLKNSIETIPFACRIGFAAILIGAFGEGFQHVVEMWLGMFSSRAAFEAEALNPARLAAGGVKVAGVLAAGYFATLSLVNARGVVPEGTTFRSQFLRTSWAPTSGLIGIICPVVLAGPLIWLHFQLNFYAIGHPVVWIVWGLLALDSLLIGFLALVLGVAIWATEFQGPVASSVEG